MSTPDWTMSIPPEWKTADWDERQTRLMLTVDKAGAAAAQAMLKDGTNLLGLMWPTGQRLLRMGPDTGFEMQEHFTGSIPKEHRKVLSDVWAKLVQCYVLAAAVRDSCTGSTGVPDGDGCTGPGDAVQVVARAKTP